MLGLRGYLTKTCQRECSRVVVVRGEFPELSCCSSRVVRGWFPERQQVQEAPAGDREQPGQPRGAAAGARAGGGGSGASGPAPSGRCRGARRATKPARRASSRYSADRAIARMLELGRGPDQASAQQEVHARLQVREVGHRHEQLAAGPQHAVQFGERHRLLLERQVLEHVEAQRAIERRPGHTAAP